VSIKLIREVFVAVLGTTPQVLTECLYYYYSEHYGEKRYFDQIVVITTAAGNKALMDGIISKFRIHDLENELGVPKGTIPFSHADVHQIHDEKGVPLVDIRSTKDNQIATEQIFSIIKSITDDESTRLTATVAGGRKTMSTTMALAYQIFARQQDELIHIITHDSKFGAPEWYFPDDPKDQTQQLDVSKVSILKVGRYLKRNLIGNPDELMAEMQDGLKGLEPLTSVVVGKRTLIVNDLKIMLTPRIAAIMRFLLKRRLISKCPNKCTGCSECCVDRNALIDAARRELIDELETISGSYSGHYLRYKENRIAADHYTINNRLDEDISRQRSTISKSAIPFQNKELLKINKVFSDPANPKNYLSGILIDKGILTIEG
jgi:CRISPR-associated protein (TIGR02584 family)